MNVEIGAEATLFPEKEYISGIFVAVYSAWALPEVMFSGTITETLVLVGIMFSDLVTDIWARN